MFLNVDQLQKQLDKDNFQEDDSAFWVFNRQFQKFIDLQFTLDYDSQMTDKYFVEYTGIEVKQFRKTLLQHMINVKKSVAERTRHKRLYDRRWDIIWKTRYRLGNDADADTADIRPVYDKELMVEDAEQCQVTSPLLDPSLDNKTTRFSNQSLESENICLKKTVAQFQKDFSRMEVHCIALELKYQDKALKIRATWSNFE
ncbi:hypothetical protein Tco_0272430 [Tanacetum coccineum]